MKKLLAHWKTSLAGLLIFVAIGLYFVDIIDREKLTTSVALLAGLGLLGGADAKTKLNDK